MAVAVTFAIGFENGKLEKFDTVYHGDEDDVWDNEHDMDWIIKHLAKDVELKFFGNPIMAKVLEGNDGVETDYEVTVRTTRFYMLTVQASDEDAAADLVSDMSADQIHDQGTEYESPDVEVDEVNDASEG